MLIITHSSPIRTMKRILYCFVLYLTVNFGEAASTHKEDNVLIKNDWELFNHPVIDHKRDASDCKCPKYPRPIDCGEVLENGHNVSGVYTIYPRSRVLTCDTLQVYCDMETDGGGWTVLQRRGAYGNAENYFAKNWETYKNGFGNLKKEFWLGNDNIHVLTNQASYSVRFDLRKVNGASAFTLYDTFWIEDESQTYKLHIDEFSGNGGNAMLAHSLKVFHTMDSKNKPDERHIGGWWTGWYPSTNLNGLNKQGQDKQKIGNGIAWYGFGGPISTYQFESMAHTEIKVRQIRFD